jgi:wobble nucleotide-excising tRNase
LDGDRQAKVDSIATHIRDYETALRTLEAAMAPPLDEPFSTETNLQSAWEAVHAKLKANLAAMRLKQEKPGEAADVGETDVGPLKTALASLNTRIGEFNQRIRDRAGERDAIRESFWQNMCCSKISAYRTYDTVISPLRVQRESADGKSRDAASRHTACINALADLRKRQEGVDASVDAINERLDNLGIDSFAIAKKDGAGSLYCLKRPHQGESKTESLSEGEKTLISFLYFMELLKGSAQQGAVVDVRKTIVVIDDPISSLSHNFVYDVTTIICQELIRPPGGQQVRQVIVLTHSLFFLHELTYQLGGGNLERAADKCQLLRVVKGSHSQVGPMNARDFANDYDALWQIIRDAKEGIVAPIVVPNTMRCILESFFAFTGAHGQFEDILKRLSDGDGTFKPLERYLNRGAHRDAVNAMNIDWGQFSTDYYLAKLQAVFTEAGYPEHYRMKMGLPEAA